MTCFDIFDFGDAYVELHHNFPCETKEQLLAEEGRVMRELKDVCVNSKIMGRTKAEYYQDNKEKLLADNAMRRQTNKSYLAVNRAYYTANRDAILARINEKLTCDCGCEVNRSSLQKHQQTNKHKKLMEALQN